MFFSVVIPTHKRKQMLSDLLTTLEQQTFDRSQFEVFIIATEKDEAFDIDLSSLSFKVSISSIPNDPTNGKSASAKRNYGASLAKGDWIAFTDDDCLTHKDWLQEAFNVISKNDIEFLEGAVHIPEPKLKTFTYKGIKRLSRPGGFQTCNMFYKRSDFLEISGFDPLFPYYLEDTDLAWSFKEAGKKHMSSEKAIISHPVPPAAPHKMLESAYRMRKLPRLYRKHPQTFKASQMRAYPRAYLILLLFDGIGFLSFFVSWKHAIAIYLLRLLLTDILILRMLKGCHKNLKEALAMYYYLLICPLISFIQLIKGNWENRVWVFFK